MLDSKLADLLASLSETEYMTSKALAEKNETSDRTVQTRIRELREELEPNGATIESKPRHGYRLVVQDRDRYKTWLQTEQARMQKAIPNSVDERFRYMLAKFLESEQYWKLEDLAEQLCVSSKTLSNELKQVEFVLGHYNLELQRKPHYGMRVYGEEFDKRKCCMDYLVQPYYEKLDQENTQSKLTSLIGDVLLDVMMRQRVKFSEAAFQNIVFYLYVAWMRTQEGNVIRQARPEQLARVEKMQEYQIARLLVDHLREMEVKIEPTPAEAMYIAVYIAGRRILGDEYKLQSSPVVLQNISQLSGLLLDCIQRVYNLDFKENLNIRIALYNHLATFHIRMTYGIPMPNPILEEIKQNYPFAFAIAQRAMVELERFYGRKVSEAETGYFAIILEMALESLKEEIEKKNILLVCMTGKASSRFLSFRFRNEFGVYINRLDVCSMYEFEQYDLSGIDYVFTTVPLHTAVGVPIYEIGNFLDDADIPQVRKKLEQGSTDFLRSYYRPELFFPHIAGSTREEIIRELSHRLAQVYPIPEETFCASVLAREQLGGTDFGNQVAIPHPEECMIQKNIVCVGILDKPVLWSTHMVQLVVLVSIYESASAQTQKFYQLTSSLLSDQMRVKRIISRREYEHFMKLLLE